MVGQKLAPFSDCCQQHSGNKKNRHQELLSRTLASNGRANPAGRKIPENQNRNGAFRRAHRPCAGDEKGSFGPGMWAYQTFDQNIPVVGNPSTQEFDLYKTHDGNYQRTINPYAYIRPHQPQTRMRPANYRKIRGALASPTALLSVPYSYLCIYNRSVIVSWLRVCP